MVVKRFHEFSRHQVVLNGWVDLSSQLGGTRIATQTMKKPLQQWLKLMRDSRIGR